MAKFEGKLAEALNERKRLKERVAQLQKRAQGSASFNEGEKPLEEVNRVIEDIKGTIAAYADLVRRINASNDHYPIQVGDSVMSLAAAIIERDNPCKWYQVILQSIVGSVRTSFEDRYGNREKSRASAVDIDARETEIDGLGKRFRLIDNAIQKANWEYDLRP